MKRLRSCCSCTSTMRLQLGKVLHLEEVEESLQLCVNNTQEDPVLIATYQSSTAGHEPIL